MNDFDVAAVHAALDAQRRARGLTWAELTKEITGPEPGAIASSSFTGMTERGAVNGNVVMAALRWLDRTPESFIAEHPDATTKPTLPSDLPRRFFGRWDVAGLHEALDAQRQERGLTWTQAAREIGLAPSVLARYTRPDTVLVSFPAIIRVTQWLGRPLTDFIHREPQQRGSSA